MARKELTKVTVRTLFSRTGNQCAFPGCRHPLIDEDDDFVAEICHIEAASPGGPRFNAEMTDDERRDPRNLLILCHRHHVKVDNADRYTTAALREMKADHEAKWSERHFDVPEKAIEEILEEESRYWREVAVANQNWLSAFDLATPLRVSADPLDYVSAIRREMGWFHDLFDELGTYSAGLQNEIAQFLRQIGVDPSRFEAVEYYKNPFHAPFWEMLSIGVPNRENAVETNLLLLEVFLLFQRARLAPHNSALRAELDEKKALLLERAAHMGVVD
jgi:hypothetical protein